MKMEKAKNKRRTVAWAAICAATLAAGSATRCEPNAAFAEDEDAVVEQANE